MSMKTGIFMDRPENDVLCPRNRPFLWTNMAKSAPRPQKEAKMWTRGLQKRDTPIGVSLVIYGNEMPDQVGHDYLVIIGMTSSSLPA